MATKMIPIAIITLILGLLCTYMSLRSMALSPFLARHPWWTWGVFIFLLSTTFLIPVLARNAGHNIAIAAWASYILFGVISTYIVYLGIADLSQFLLRRFLNAPPSTGVWALGIAVSATIISVIVGGVQALSPPKVHRVEVPILGLNKSLEGFTIVQITDLHINSMVSKSSLEQLTLQVNALNPNVVAITGDLVDGPVSDLLPKVAVLRNLKPKNCVCYVTGHHEYYTGDLQKWLDVFSHMEWCVLMNNNVFIQRNEAKLAIIGIPDSTAKSITGFGPKPDIAHAISETPAGTPKILLHHKPTNFFEAERAGIVLQLSGHTHGGQYFPWSMIIPLFHDYPRGLKRYKRMWIYTSTGTGFWGPPNRFLLPKELTLLVLKRT